MIIKKTFEHSKFTLIEMKTIHIMIMDVYGETNDEKTFEDRYSHASHFHCFNNMAFCDGTDKKYIH